MGAPDSIDSAVCNQMAASACVVKVEPVGGVIARKGTGLAGVGVGVTDQEGVAWQEVITSFTTAISWYFIGLRSRGERGQAMGGVGMNLKVSHSASVRCWQLRHHGL
jgi:hypothetical protein